MCGLRAGDPTQSLKRRSQITKEVSRQFLIANRLHIVAGQTERTILQRLPKAAELFLNLAT